MTTPPREYRHYGLHTDPPRDPPWHRYWLMPGLAGLALAAVVAWLLI